MQRKTETTNDINLLLIDPICLPGLGLKTDNDIIQHNSVFLTKEIERIQLGRYKSVRIASAGKKQDHRNNHIRSKTTRLSFIIQSHLASRLSCPVTADLLWMGDITTKNTHAGESYLNASEEKSTKETTWPGDDERITHVYAHAHRLTVANPKANNVIDFYGSSDEELYRLHQFYQQNRDFLPKQIKLRLHKLNQGRKVNTITSPNQATYALTEIQGTAEKIDVNYEWSIRWFGLKAAGAKLKNISVDKFKKLHETTPYNKKINLTLFTKEDIAEFKYFRERTFLKFPITEASSLKHTTEKPSQKPLVTNEKFEIIRNKDNSISFIKATEETVTDQDHASLSDINNNQTNPLSNENNTNNQVIVNEDAFNLDKKVDKKTLRQHIDEYFLAGKLSLNHYMQALLKHNEHQQVSIQPNLDVNFTKIVVAIANESIWNKQGFHLFSNQAPHGIQKIRKRDQEHNLTSAHLKDIAIKIKPKFGDKHHHLGTRSEMTRDFYELIYILHLFTQDKKKYPAELGMDMVAIFCKKWKIAVPDRNEYILANNLSNIEMR